jgi:hypothetical protein
MPHIVTGQVTNTKVSLNRRHRSKVRAACHEAIRAHRRGELTKEMKNRLRGRLAHVRRTNPGTAVSLDRKLQAAGLYL